MLPLFNHCKEMKRLQEVANSKMSLKSLPSPRCNFYQDQNDSFSKVHQKVLRLSNFSKSYIARSLKGSHSSAMGCSHLKMQQRGCNRMFPSVMLRCAALLICLLVRQQFCAGPSLATGLYSKEGAQETGRGVLSKHSIINLIRKAAKPFSARIARDILMLRENTVISTYHNSNISWVYLILLFKRS